MQTKPVTPPPKSPQGKYTIGKIVVHDVNQNDRYDSKTDKIFDENGVEILEYSPQVSAIMLRIGLDKVVRGLHHLPLSMTEAIYNRVNRLGKLYETYEAFKTHPLLRRPMNALQEKALLQIGDIWEYSRLQVGLRAYCARGSIKAWV
ncbi:MAG TPA: hypothetical protein VJR29_00320 [bacterium]|nr:hypothetical protein [bacterium]